MIGKTKDRSLVTWLDWRKDLMELLEAELEELRRRHERTERLLGEAAFLDRIKALLNRSVQPVKRGPRLKQQETN